MLLAEQDALVSPCPAVSEFIAGAFQNLEYGYIQKHLGLLGAFDFLLGFCLAGMRRRGLVGNMGNFSNKLLHPSSVS